MIKQHRYHLILSFLGFLFPLLMMAQKPEGNVEIIQDPGIADVVEKHITVNQNREGFPGYRIQIFFDSGTQSKVKAIRVSRAFHQAYPGKGIYLTFDSPNYKVRVGDFPNRLDAFRFLMQILPEYPGAYIVKDQIKVHTTTSDNTPPESAEPGDESSDETSTL